jgi:uncharacterized surface protein with fasciclin (FAS1) repeats
MFKMLQAIRKSRGLFVVAASFGLMTTIAACANPDTASTTTGTESPSAITESPSVNPTVGSSPSTTNTLGTVSDVLAGNSSFSTLLAAVQAAGLQQTLSEPGPVTVFAPTDQAFAALPAGTVDKLLLPENKEQLRKILSYHVVPGKVTSADIKPGEVATVEGQTVSIASSANNVTVNDASVSQPDVAASNGVIHGIDKVLLPPDVQL